MRFATALFLAALVGCGGGAGSPPVASMSPATKPPTTGITHVIVVLQENRTPDDLFQFLPGANIASSGQTANGKTVALKPRSLTAPYDIKHRHADWLAAWNNGAMNGWDRETCGARCPFHPAFGYVPQAEVQPYYTLAETYAFGDELFQTNEGPSFPAHQYLVSGTSTIADGSSLRAAENPGTVFQHKGGCDSSPSTLVTLIDPYGSEAQKAYPCFNRSSIFGLLDAAGVTWRYYQANAGAGLWNAVDALQPIWSNKTEFASNVVTPSAQVLTDIASGNLAQVSFVTPTAVASDHAGVTDGSGPSWVASIVNAVGASQYWPSTLIIVTWDDWGGWYDHATTTQRNSYELGFRVPLVVVGPMVKAGYVSHTQYEFGSILKEIEEVYGLPSLGTTDTNANDLSDFFSGSVRRPYRQVRAPLGASYFLRHAVDRRIPDED